MLVKGHRDLDVYRRSFDAAMLLFELSQSFPKEERYSLTDQMRRSSRSVTSQIAEAWQKRAYEASFQAKLRDACAEAAETQTWIDYSVACGYLPSEQGAELDETYEGILRSLRGMIMHSSKWTGL
jgi:four helix bundle protein